MSNVIYRWKIHSGKEEQFQNAWDQSDQIPLPENTSIAAMKDAIASSEPPIQMTLISNLLSE